MDRETAPFKIGGHEVIAKIYATAREANAIKQAYFKGTKLEIVGDQPKINEFDPGIQYHVYLEMIRQMVVSFDGSPDNIVERCEELPNADFADLTAKLDEIVSKKN